IVAGVLAQVEELLHIGVPNLEIGRDSALALAALVHRDRGVVDDLQEGHDALALAVRALDAAAERADVCPVVAESPAPLREQRVVADALEDMREVVLDRRQEAGGELWMPGSGVEERRAGRADAERRERIVEFDGAVGPGLRRL